ncbi:MAG: hypothetical protein AAGI63_16145 [Planctomycetota bacterium]
MAFLVVLALPLRAVADENAAQRGYQLLTEVPLLTSDFSQAIFDEVWRSWPEPLRSKAEKATLQERREMAFERYGLTTRPNDDSGKPLQYVVDASGNWTMNCLSCHGGSVYGKPTVGAPNNRFALQTMTEELRSTKFRMGKSLSRMDLGSAIIPLGTTNGTTNAVVFGMGLMSYRDEQLNIIPNVPETFVHHDMDAPPWWHFHKRPYLYIDGFAQKGHRGLMQFTMIPENGPQFFRDREDDFRNVYALLASLRAPKYPGTIDAAAAKRGRLVFESNCSNCHGTYGDSSTYPNRRVPLDEIGTDPVRLTALNVSGREKYGRSWFAHAGESNEQETVKDPDGYVAPPLDGVWASPPYFHNGSVPTLWHVLHPSDRPVVWRRSDEKLDQEKVGFHIVEADRVPLTEKDVAVRRSYFDTRRFGKNNSGHDYPDLLTEPEKSDLLEFLKTL